MGQIAEKLGCSPWAVSVRLRQLGIGKSIKKTAFNDPKNYCAPVVPYGFRKVKRQLVPCPKEMKICRLVVNLINKQGLSRNAVGRYLKAEGFKNRSGKTTWDKTVVTSIYKRWDSKI